MHPHGDWRWLIANPHGHSHSPLCCGLLFSSTLGIGAAAFTLVREMRSLRQALPYRASRPQCSEPSPHEHLIVLLSVVIFVAKTPLSTASGSAHVTYAVIDCTSPS